MLSGAEDNTQKGRHSSPQTVSRPDLLVDGQDVAFRDLLSNFFAFSENLAQARGRFAKFIGLSASQYMILIVLDRLEKKGAIGINQIAGHLRYSGAFVTIEVNQLVKAGYIEKGRHPTDGRRVVLTLTDCGRNALTRLAKFQRPVNDALFEPLAAQDFHALRDIIARLAANYAWAFRVMDLVGSELNNQPDDGDGAPNISEVA